jgi:hypothetical protein
MLVRGDARHGPRPSKSDAANRSRGREPAATEWGIRLNGAIKKRVAQDLVSQPLPSNSRVAIQATFYNSLSRGTQRRKCLALIGSGADQIMMPSAIAEALGIDRDRVCSTNLAGRLNGPDRRLRRPSHRFLSLAGRLSPPCLMSVILSSRNGVNIIGLGGIGCMVPFSTTFSNGRSIAW